MAAKKNADIADMLKHQQATIDLLVEEIRGTKSELRETKDSLSNMKKLCRRLVTLVSIRKLNLYHESIKNSSMKFMVGDGEELTWWDIPTLNEKYGSTTGPHKRGKTQRKCDVCRWPTVHVCRCCSDVNRMLWVCQPVDDRNLNCRTAVNRANRWRHSRGLPSSSIADISVINHCWLKHTTPDVGGTPEEDLNDLLSSDEGSSNASESNSNRDSDADREL